MEIHSAESAFVTDDLMKCVDGAGVTAVAGGLHNEAGADEIEGRKGEPRNELRRDGKEEGG